MIFLRGTNEIAKLSKERQEAFTAFWKEALAKKLRPVFAEVTLLLMMIGAAFDAVRHILTIAPGQVSWSSFHPLIYVYWGVLLSLFLINRIQRVRERSPLVHYLIFSYVIGSSYLVFVLAGGGLDPIFGLFYLSAFVGFSTASVKHSVTIIALNVMALLITCRMLFGSVQWGAEAAKILSYWFVFHCILVGIVSAAFMEWIWKNLLAMQFFLNDRNEELTQTFKALKSTEEQLIQQQKTKALNHMAKGLLQEIIRPINNSSQAITLAQSQNKDEDVNEALEEAVAQHNRVKDIVADLRRFAQPEFKSEKEAVSVSGLLAQALKFNQAALRQASVEIDQNIAKELLLTCHPSSLIQVFVNVLSNAVDALDRSRMGRTKQITVDSYEQTEELVIVFKDNGVGISPERLKRIKDPFYSDESSEEKLGLGLSICDTIMRSHGGSMQIDSQVNEWTEVKLFLPNRIPTIEPTEGYPDQEIVADNSAQTPVHINTLNIRECQ